MTDPRVLLQNYASNHVLGQGDDLLREDFAPLAFAALRAVLDLADSKANETQDFAAVWPEEIYETMTNALKLP